MVKQLLMDYLEQNNIPVVIRKKRSYLTYEGIPDRYVYILKKGIIKTSVVTHEGREFNLRYMNDFDIVSLFKDESSQEVEAPFNVRVESEEAELYKIVRDQFWTDVNQNRALQDYVKEYYRKDLMYSMKKMQQMLLNGKLGAVCTQLYELYDLFGVRTEEGMLIDFSITNEEIAKFCGISTASSVNRILKQLKKDGIITVKDHHIVILNMDLLEDNIIF